MNFDAILDAPDTPAADTTPVDATPADDTSSSSPDSGTADTSDATDPNAVADETAGDDTNADPNADASADTPAADAVAGDGRTIPAKWKELFKNDKELKSLYFSNAEFRKHFETPAKAKEFLADLEAAGGIDGLKQASTTLQEIDTAIAAGDSKIVERFAAAEGFPKLVPAVMAAYAKSDEAGYTHIIASSINDTLHQSGFIQGFELLKSIVADNPQAKSILDKMSAFLGGVDQLAKTKPEGPKVDPERQKFLEEKQQFQTERQEAFRKDIGSSVASTITTGIKTSLAPYLKNRTTDKEDYALLERNVNLELGQLLNGDANFQKQKDALLKTGDKAKIVKCMEAAIAKHLPAAAKKVGRLFGASQAPVVVKKEPAPANNATVQKLSATPQAHEVDWSRPGAQDDFLDGKAVLKNGKRVTF